MLGNPMYLLTCALKRFDSENKPLWFYIQNYFLPDMKNTYEK